VQIILALGRSKGTPGKNVINFHEKPILAETIQQWMGKNPFK
jgi:CMP-N-acetylneuraminic acid synthetase